MDFLYLLEKIRLPGLNELMLAVTRLGEETALLVIALIVFWCFNKRQGYYILSVGLLGTLANQFMKLWFRIPRPWVRDPDFTVLKDAVPAAGGYSFPSGHTQTAVGNFGALSIYSKKRCLRGLWLLLAVVVPFSRMYVGVHTPADVLTAAAMAVFFLLILHPLVMGHDGKYIPWVLGVLIALSAAFLAFVSLYPFPADLDAHNYESGFKNAYTLLGCTTGLLVVWFADRRLKFDTQAIWWVQILKVVLGLALVLAVKEGLRTPLEVLCGGHMIARAIRYFLIVVVAGIIWPLTFRLLPRKKENL